MNSLSSDKLKLSERGRGEDFLRIHHTEKTEQIPEIDDKKWSEALLMKNS